MKAVLCAVIHVEGIHLVTPLEGRFIGRDASIDALIDYPRIEATAVR
jgi:hypothetical protein